ncbi:hypothetical protein ISN44_As09g021990 [Arabidopsis suecica]|uniref:NYN domain-containing protein n=1 Tax=Arabidopsis suecica TaxID=45249 RepID=A0A8T2AJK7_ARASU|nr:hypothetical protein ISN44_As09g021990 [Arabidopsis suecica]
MNSRGPWYSSNTCVIWLVEEIPTSSDPNGYLISSNIRSALERMGYLGEERIWCYGPENQSSTEAEWFDVCYESIGDKDKRVRRMLFDMITFASSCDDGKQNNMMVISKTPLTDECFRVLGSFEARGFNVLLVQYDDEAELFRSADAIFDSTTLLDGSRPMDFDSVSWSSFGNWETDSDPGNCTDTVRLDLSSLSFNDIIL